MTQRTDTISITDEGAVLDAGYEAIALSYGWTDTIKDEAGEETPNPQSAQDKAIAVTKGFWRDIIVSYQSQQAAEQARLAAMAATGESIGNITITLEKGE